jgi:hypothetical protein
MSQNLKENHWTKDAACNFDKKLLSFHIDDDAENKKRCRSCPVLKDCEKWIGEFETFIFAAGKSRYDRLLGSWGRVDRLDESNFG